MEDCERDGLVLDAVDKLEQVSVGGKVRLVKVEFKLIGHMLARTTIIIVDEGPSIEKNLAEGKRIIKGSVAVDMLYAIRRKMQLSF